MADHALEQTVIEASPAQCYAVASDVETYPDWAPDIKAVTVVERDDQDRPSLVAYRAAAMGHSTSYTLRYDYSDAPRRLAWVLESGDIARKLDGYYDFAPVAGDPSRTDVSYELVVELVFPLPVFIKRRAELKIIHTALRDLKHRVETLQTPSGDPA